MINSRPGGRRESMAGVEGDAIAAGWYADPSGPLTLCWWDGRQWTDRTAPIAPPVTGWRQWLTTSPAAGRLGVVIAVLASLAAAVCVVIVAVDLIRQRAVPAVALLLIVGIPLIAIGQLCMIGQIQIQIRQPASAGRRKRAIFRRQNSGPTNPRKFFFGPLTPRLARTFLALGLLGWLAAMTAVPWITGGSPAGSGGGCAYRLENHGSYSCVTHSAYEQAGAGVQRFATGILLSFFSLHADAALGG